MKKLQQYSLTYFMIFLVTIILSQAACPSGTTPVEKTCLDNSNCNFFINASNGQPFCYLNDANLSVWRCDETCYAYTTNELVTAGFLYCGIDSMELCDYGCFKNAPGTDASCYQNPICDNNCTSPGLVDCYDSNTRKVCTLDASNCRNWVNYACPGGQTCSNGYCGNYGTYNNITNQSSPFCNPDNSPGNLCLRGYFNSTDSSLRCYAGQTHNCNSNGCTYNDPLGYEFCTEDVYSSRCFGNYQLCNDSYVIFNSINYYCEDLTNYCYYGCLGGLNTAYCNTTTATQTYHQIYDFCIDNNTVCLDGWINNSILTGQFPYPELTLCANNSNRSQCTGNGTCQNGIRLGDNYQAVCTSTQKYNITLVDVDNRTQYYSDVQCIPGTNNKCSRTIICPNSSDISGCAANNYAGNYTITGINSSLLYYYCNDTDMTSCAETCMNIIYDVQQDNITFIPSNKTCQTIYTTFPYWKIQCSKTNNFLNETPDFGLWLMGGLIPGLYPLSQYGCDIVTEQYTIPSARCTDASVNEWIDLNTSNDTLYIGGSCLVNGTIVSPNCPTSCPVELENYTECIGTNIGNASRWVCLLNTTNNCYYQHNESCAANQFCMSGQCLVNGTNQSISCPTGYNLYYNGITYYCAAQTTTNECFGFDCNSVSDNTKTIIVVAVIFLTLAIILGVALYNGNPIVIKLSSFAAALLVIGEIIYFAMIHYISTMIIIVLIIIFAAIGVIVWRKIFSGASNSGDGT